MSTHAILPDLPPVLPPVLQQEIRALFQAGRYAELERIARVQVAQQPDVVFFWNALGLSLHAQGKDATLPFRMTVTLSPDNADAYVNLGIALYCVGQFESAIENHRMALTIRPDFAIGYHNLGAALEKVNRADEALQCYVKALECDPDFAEPNNALAIMLNNVGRSEEALLLNDKALRAKPGFVNAYSTHGFILHDLARFDEARSCWLRALELDANFADASMNYAMSLLMHGEFSSGWRCYESRWDSGKFESRKPFSPPLWLGDADLRGKTILLHVEQGLGDTLQFIRYVGKFAALGARVMLYVLPSLRFLLHKMPGVSGTYVKGDPLPHFDYHCPLMSLPLAFKTELASIPADVPYLAAPAARVQYWHEKLAGAVPRVGLVWSGGSVYQGNYKRSMPLQALVPLLDNTHCRFFSLQKDVQGEDVSLLQSLPGVTDLSAVQFDLSEAAAIIANLDLVITVDTSVAHLAGALGKPVWIMLPYVADWRWMLKREDSPWYPTARLFRQSAMGDWGGVVARIDAALSAL